MSAAADAIAADLRCVSVPNTRGPSGQPTNVYVVGMRQAILIDAGSDDGGATVLAALERWGVAGVAQIVLTHAHHDHAGSAPAIQAATGATTRLHPRERASTSRWNVDLRVDAWLRDGEIIEADAYRFEVLETPGHAPGHVSFYEPTLRALFAGDLLSGNGTIAVVPPRGSMGDYLASLRRVGALTVDVIYPGHGPAIPNGNERIAQYIAHRERREQEIRDAIDGGLATVGAITDRLYADVLPRIRPQAEGTVLAHVIHLIEDERVRIVEQGATLAEARFAVAD